MHIDKRLHCPDRSIKLYFGFVILIIFRPPFLNVRDFLCNYRPTWELHSGISCATWHDTPGPGCIKQLKIKWDFFCSRSLCSQGFSSVPCVFLILTSPSSAELPYMEILQNKDNGCRKFACNLKLLYATRPRYFMCILNFFIVANYNLN